MFQNLTLAGLHQDDLDALTPHLSERRVARGDVLIAQGALVEQVHFPTTAYLANTVTFSDGRSAETFVMGVEGVSGLAPFLADAPCAWAVEVTTPGDVYEMSASILRGLNERSPRLRRQLLRLCNDYQAQASMGVACAALHNATARLARFLLVSMERTRADHLNLTQEDLGALLGVQRTTVNASAMELKAFGAVTYSRGKIRLKDRDALRRAACECYPLHKALMH